MPGIMVLTSGLFKIKRSAISGIVIPSRQTDVTLREIDWLRDAVKQYVANSYNGRAAGNGSHVPVAAVADQSE